MNSPQSNLTQFCNSAMNALKRAYEECPHGTAGSFIIIASNAIIRLEHELEKGTAPNRLNHPCGGTHFQSTYDAAA